jgi:5-methylcytosine-specific restriction protein B
VKTLIALLKRVNMEIKDPHYSIGVSFFMKRPLESKLQAIWQLDIEPYLQEYFFNRPGIAEGFRWHKIERELYS